jgi:UDP-N-acetyl-D-mannosaminouronate:lipid I N-acetyl-D-mannosaminouronosyltransferase
MIYKKLNKIKTYIPATREELIDFAFQEKKMLIAVNAEKILHANEEFSAIINQNIGYPDGIGAVWLLHKKGHKEAVKIPGCELWLDIVKKHQKEKSFYLVGGTQNVLEQTLSQLKADFPEITISNFRNGFLKTEDEKAALLEDIKSKKPDVVFVAMGSPKQEKLMQEMQEIHEAVYQGLGGSFDVYTKNVLRAPKWWVENNLEWAYRLVKQPKRIIRQVYLLKFYFLLKTNKL